MNFSDRHVLVTGGAGALGAAVVGSLLAAGAFCYVPLRSEREAEEFAHRGHARLSLVLVANLADESAVKGVYAVLPQLWASIQLAGGFAYAPIDDTGPDLLRSQLETNLVTCYLCCRAAVHVMRPGGRGGRIVNVAARPALEWRAGANMTAYAASKAAVAALTTALAEEVVKHGILVNAVAPSILDTPANRRDMPKADFAQWPKVEEVAKTILFLASPENTTTRGAVVPVYGRS